jgi:maltose alpha-D-glucosyltransferase/alpha-amylase
VSGGWETVLEGTARQSLEKDILPRFLPRQRWFGGKARRIESVRLVDRADLPAGAATTFWVFIDVRLDDGATQLYLLPLGVMTGAAADELSQAKPSRLLAGLTGPGGEGILYDALADTDACSALLDAIGNGREYQTVAGRIRAYATAAYTDLRGFEPRLVAGLGPETSSNSLVFYGDRLLLKLFRRLEIGINPDFEIGRFLTERNFDRIPKVAGTIEYHRPGQRPVTLAILQALIPNQGDGWQHALEELSLYFGSAFGPVPGFLDVLPLELAEREPPRGLRSVMQAYLQTAGTLGKRTAEMHLALAADSTDPAFTPEPLTSTDLAALQEEIRDQGRQALSSLRDNLDRLPNLMTPVARRLLDEAWRFLDDLDYVSWRVPDAVKIRCHGDYHLGQVLWANRDFILLDFEGEPTRSVEARRTKQSPLKDVAGMLRSFNYAAYAGLFAFTQNRPGEYDRLEPWAEVWQQWSGAAFLKAYQATVAGAPFLPSQPAQLHALLNGFMLAKAFYELVYELNNRPDWVRIPLRGILTLLADQSRGGPDSRFGSKSMAHWVEGGLTT